MNSEAIDLSKFTRPAVLCQCSRCLSSLAVLENEWVKLSNSYSVVSGWLSCQLQRISISTEKKQIPQSSELSLIRGRIVQEIGCKLCHQKLGALCALDNGPNIFWKLPKVSLLEIVTMRPVEPVFKEGAGVLEDLLFPKPKAIGFGADGPSSRPGPLISVGSNDNREISVEHHIQQQGQSLDHISSSVSTLHDTMHELKNAFTAMRIELNGPNRFLNEQDLANTDFNMVTTVLKELKSKADEIEKLKLEIEALKLRNRFVEEHTARQTQHSLVVEAPLPEVRSPGLLQGSRKRPFPFPEHYNGVRERPASDSFDEEDVLEDNLAGFSLTESSIPSVKIPLKDHETTREPVHESSPRLQIGVDNSTYQTPQSLPSDEPAVKRPRLSSEVSVSNKRPRGRPSRKSLSQADSTQNPGPRLPDEQGSSSKNPQATPNIEQKPMEDLSARSHRLRSRSRAASLSTRNQLSTENADKSQQDSTTSSEPSTQLAVQLGKENAELEFTRLKADEGKRTKAEMNEKRKAQAAARDNMVKLAMQREEAMDTEEAR
ncbi:hypothetical protein AN7565.2 [Aspergillus nidulans FGSC A4]|uniref:Mis18 domain-containing protein n=1 Tax=Emericella nidulans (strain FGSC A4 / ATCC 38163 / CBS 112.46 / NRRL 194 / M139) TaxID=227321 RepID=Q5AVW5_EMENI|nr:hypothetical protein [Aspergillus nidulans FGSC A4]EAA62145.1 hypothetical protein AN7565.2 [Aspergillus nidulans FGSC A4]CBF79640.1 TPA: conserved hypothetical protein [Aspergillus nidulans FGSC A4]|eukprot:XP_680834.1 hypothetical protein AN7565.2 [Aspergillus nidulans FGSC A4]